MTAPKPPSERFWSHVDKTEDCWLWTATPSPDGYGRFWPQKRDQILAHRWAYEDRHGPVPDGLQLDHLCRVRRCVNPDHLEPVTGRVNSLRGISPWALNARRTHCAQGHEFNEQNTRLDRRGRRVCKRCIADRSKRLRAKKLASMTPEQLQAFRAKENARWDAWRSKTGAQQ